jgi:hypothetical protein
MSELLAKLDPFGTGQVSFNAFVEGIQSFLSGMLSHLPGQAYDVCVTVLWNNFFR